VRRHRFAGGQAGFTLVELVVVVIVVAILAVVAIPRLNPRAFDNVSFHQEALAAMRYAQKEAIAKRRNVCVTVASTSVTVRFARLEASTTCDADLTSPRGATPFVITGRPGVTLTATPAIPGTFYFDPLGRPFDAAGTASPQRTIGITGDATRTFLIEPETGYVH